MRIGGLLILFCVLFLMGCGREEAFFETFNDNYQIRVFAKKAQWWNPEGYDVFAEIKENGSENSLLQQFDHIDVKSDFLRKFVRWDWSDTNTLCLYSEHFQEVANKAKVTVLNPERLSLALVSIETSSFQCLEIDSDSVVTIEFEIPVDTDRLNWIRVLASGPQIDSQISKSLSIQKVDLEVPIVVEVRSSGIILIGEYAEVD